MGQTIFRAFLAAILFCVTPTSNAAEYVVQPGDSLSKIARDELGAESRWQEVATLNGIQEPYSLQVGQHLTLPDDSTAGRDDGRRGFTFPIWTWAVVLLALSWLTNSLCLQVGCWFSLVETSFVRCAVLSVLLSLSLLLCLGVVVGLGTAALREAVPWMAVPITGGLLAVAYPIAAAVAMKQTFECKWRSIATIWVMTALVGGILNWALMFGVSAGFPNLMNTAAAGEFVSLLLQGH